jgi:hypothetical protein
LVFWVGFGPNVLNGKLFTNRHDQRAFLFHFTGRCSAKSPHNRAGSVLQKARSSRAAFLMPNDRRTFRLRFRDGRYAPAPFRPSLRLRFTFPFAEPQAEALSWLITLKLLRNNSHYLVKVLINEKSM